MLQTAILQLGLMTELQTEIAASGYVSPVLILYLQKAINNLCTLHLQTKVFFFFPFSSSLSLGLQITIFELTD